MRRWRPGELADDAAGGRAEHLNAALHRLIASQTLDAARRVLCEGARELAHADGVLLFETDESRRAATLELSYSIGSQLRTIDLHRPARLLSLDAAEAGLAHSTLDCFYEAELDRLAADWRDANRLCLTYPLRHEGALVGALAIVCLGRSRLKGNERWALRRYHQAAASSLFGAQEGARLHRLALTDPLTGVLNRRGLEEALDARRAGCGLVMIDFDDLKRLNDQTTFEIGDQVLAAIGRTLTEVADDDEVVARLGGDEFVVLVPTAGATELDERAGEISTALDSMLVPDPAAPYYRGASVGVAVRQPDEAAQVLVRRASEQMRRQKRRRKSDRDP